MIDAAGTKPVTFRWLDIGGETRDTLLAYARDGGRLLVIGAEKLWRLRRETTRAVGPDPAAG